MEFLKLELIDGCGNPECQNQYCRSSSQFIGGEIDANDQEQLQCIYDRFGNLSLCMPTVEQIICRWLDPVAVTQEEAWCVPVHKIEVCDLEAELANHGHIMQETSFELLSSVLSCNMSSLESLEYFLVSDRENDMENLELNRVFLMTLLELEEEDPALNQVDEVIEMNGPVTQFIEKLLDTLFSNTYLLCRTPGFVARPKLLLTLLCLPEHFIQRSNIATVCVASLFSAMPKQAERVDFAEYFQQFLIALSPEEQFNFLDSIVACCNQYVSVTLSLFDRPRRPVSILDLLQNKAEFLSVIELMNFIYQAVSVLQEPISTRIRELLQNEYINSNAYNITPDVEHWLVQHPYEIDLQALPLPIEMLIRARERPREFPENMFNLLEYPFILNSGTKAEIFRYECTHNIPHLAKLNVSRENIVNDTLSYIVGQAPDWMDQSARALLRIPLKVVFENEEGVDAGGLSNEFFTLICDELFSPKYNLFVYRPEERVYWFEKFPMLPEQDLQTYYCFVGVIFGLAMLNGINIANELPPLFYKKILGEPVVFEELKQLDEELYDSLVFIEQYQEDDLEDAICESFSVNESVLNQIETVDLISGGRDIPVTIYNKDAFIEQRFEYEINTSVAEQFNALRKGFLLVVECSSFKLFNSKELELILCGEPVLDFEELKKVTRYQEPYTDTHEIVEWFWRALIEDFSDQERIEFMKFTFGSARAPAGGLGRERFEIHKNGDGDDRLPTSHTCFGILMLPEYTCYESLRDKLAKAIENYEGFGLE